VDDEGLTALLLFWKLCAKPKLMLRFSFFYSASLTKVGLTALILFGMPYKNPKTHASFFLFLFRIAYEK